MGYIGKQPIVGNFQVCDAISVVNGQAAYTMQVNSTNVEPETAFHMLVSLNGVLQKPGSSFTISGSTITFASNLVTNDVIDFIILLGDVLNIGAPSDDTVTAAKLNNNIISGLTELTSAPADTDEFLISDAGTIKRIDASLVVGGNTPGFHVTLGSNQTGVSDDSWTKVNIANEVYDSDNKFASNKFTPAVAGKYFVYGALTSFGASDGVRDGSVAIYKNGSGFMYGYEGDQGSEITSGDPQTRMISGIFDLNTTDYLELYGRVNVSSGNATFQADYTFLGGFLVG
jgi:hypothetical protein